MKNLAVISTILLLVTALVSAQFQPGPFGQAGTGGPNGNPGSQGGQGFGPQGPMGPQGGGQGQQGGPGMGGQGFGPQGPGPMGPPNFQGSGFGDSSSFGGPMMPQGQDMKQVEVMQGVNVGYGPSYMPDFQGLSEEDIVMGFIGPMLFQKIGNPEQTLKPLCPDVDKIATVVSASFKDSDFTNLCKQLENGVQRCEKAKVMCEDIKSMGGPRGPNGEEVTCPFDETKYIAMCSKRFTGQDKMATLSCENAWIMEGKRITADCSRNSQQQGQMGPQMNNQQGQWQQPGQMGQQNMQCPQPQCPSGQYPRSSGSGQAGSCPNYECISGQQPIMNCQQPPMCGSGQHYEQQGMDSNNCPRYSCVTGTTGTGSGQCLPAPTCSAGQHIEASVTGSTPANGCQAFVCIPDTNMPPGGQQPCPQQPICGAGQHYVSNPNNGGCPTGSCVSDQTQQPPSGGQQQCPPCPAPMPSSCSPGCNLVPEGYTYQPPGCSTPMQCQNNRCECTQPPQQPPVTQSPSVISGLLEAGQMGPQGGQGMMQPQGNFGPQGMMPQQGQMGPQMGPQGGMGGGFSGPGDMVCTKDAFISRCLEGFKQNQPSESDIAQMCKNEFQMNGNNFGRFCDEQAQYGSPYENCKKRTTESCAMVKDALAACKKSATREKIVEIIKQKAQVDCSKMALMQQSGALRNTVEMLDRLNLSSGAQEDSVLKSAASDKIVLTAGELEKLKQDIRADVLKDLMKLFGMRQQEETELAKKQQEQVVKLNAAKTALQDICSKANEAAKPVCDQQLGQLDAEITALEKDAKARQLNAGGIVSMLANIVGGK